MKIRKIKNPYLHQGIGIERFCASGNRQHFQKGKNCQLMCIRVVNTRMHIHIACSSFSHPDCYCRFRNFTESTAWCGSRTDIKDHRRSGFPPCPEGCHDNNGFL